MDALHVNWANSCDRKGGPSRWINNGSRWRLFRKFWSSKQMWSIQGDARALWLRIDFAISAALQKERRLHEGCKSGYQIRGVKCYMVGHTPESAKPCIVIYCCDRAAFTPAQEAVMNMEAWKKLNVDYPGCFRVYTTLASRPVTKLGPEMTTPEYRREVLYCPSQFSAAYGAQLYFRQTVGLTKSTLGGFVLLGDYVYGYTAAHGALKSSDEQSHDQGHCSHANEALQLEDVELLYPPDEENFEPGEEDRQPLCRSSFDADSGIGMPAMSLLSEGDSDTGDRPDSPVAQQEVDTFEFDLEVLGHVEHVWIESDAILDCALIRITSTKFLIKFSMQSVDNIPHLGHILPLRIDRGIGHRANSMLDTWICIDGKEYAGHLDACPSLVHLPGHERLLRLTEITVPDFTFEVGHCGAWVYSRSETDGILHGHIVAGIVGTSTAYIVPTLSITAMVQEQLREQLSLPAEFSHRYTTSSSAQRTRDHRRGQDAVELKAQHLETYFGFLKDTLIDQQTKFVLSFQMPAGPRVLPSGTILPLNSLADNRVLEESRIVDEHPTVPTQPGTRVSRDDASDICTTIPKSSRASKVKGALSASSSWAQQTAVRLYQSASILSLPESSRWHTDFEITQNTTGDSSSADRSGTTSDYAFEAFISEADVSPTCQPRAKLLRRFLGDEGFSDLHNCREQLSKGSLFLQSFKKGSLWGLRSTDGPLDARLLFEKLRTSRDAEFDHRVSSEHRIGYVLPWRTKTPNFRPEVIYITDLDRMTALALIATVVSPQIDPLRSMLYRHLARETHVGFTRSPNSFELAFSLPFKALRSTKGHANAPADIQDLTRLFPGVSRQVYLHQATYSFAISGTDDCNWKAHCFVDTAFNCEDQARESAQAHYDNTTEEEGYIPLDPCSGGKYTTETEIFDPRLYFLMVLRSRLRMVVDEWTNTIIELQRGIEDISKELFADQILCKSMPMRLQMSVIVSEEMHGLLSETTHAIHGFLKKHADEFDFPEARYKAIHLATIEDLALALDQLHRQLLCQREVCKTLAARHDSLAQQQKARSSERKTLLLISLTPLLLASGVFSMDNVVMKQTLPALTASPASLLLTIFFFGGLVYGAALVFGIVQPPLTHQREKVMKWLTRVLALAQAAWERAQSHLRGSISASISSFTRWRRRRSTEQDLESYGGGGEEWIERWRRAAARRE